MMYKLSFNMAYFCKNFVIITQLSSQDKVSAILHIFLHFSKDVFQRGFVNVHPILRKEIFQRSSREV